MNPDSAATSAPRASILLIAYNQQQFIIDAVRSCFKQDYSNLEIVLSDDGSKDGTFETMCTLANAYRGPHSVVVNRTPANAGVLAHIYDAAARSTGELLVMMAGDDVSYSNRVSTLVRHWLSNNAIGLDSLVDVVDEDLRIISAGQHTNDADGFFRYLFARSDLLSPHGGAAAYSRALLTAVRCPPERIMTEDVFFPLFTYWRGGKIVRVPETLMQYRQHDQQISHQEGDWGRAALTEREHRGALNAASILRCLNLFARVVRDGEGIDRGWGTEISFDPKRLRALRAFWSARVSWLDLSVIRRMGVIAGTREWAHLRWMLPRLLGPTGLFAVRSATAYLRGRRR